GEFLDLATKRLGNDLMAETDPDHRSPVAIGIADELLKRRNPWVIFIGPMFRAGDQPAVGIGDGRGENPVHNGIDFKFKTMPSEKLLEHFAVIGELILKISGNVASLQDTDFH